MAPHESIRIHSYEPGDYGDVMALAPRLADGVAPWRDPAEGLSAVEGWVRESVDALGRPDHAVWVAANGSAVVGVVTVSQRTHFTGQADDYVGQLAVRAGMERRGIATGHNRSSGGLRVEPSALLWADGPVPGSRLAQFRSAQLRHPVPSQGSQAQAPAVPVEMGHGGRWRPAMTGVRCGVADGGCRPQRGVHPPGSGGLK